MSEYWMCSVQIRIWASFQNVKNNPREFVHKKRKIHTANCISFLIYFLECLLHCVGLSTIQLSGGLSTKSKLYELVPDELANECIFAHVYPARRSKFKGHCYDVVCISVNAQRCFYSIVPLCTCRRRSCSFCHFSCLLRSSSGSKVQRPEVDVIAGTGICRQRTITSAVSSDNLLPDFVLLGHSASFLQ